jgi:hypothetical protein
MIPLETGHAGARPPACTRWRLVSTYRVLILFQPGAATHGDRPRVLQIVIPEMARKAVPRMTFDGRLGTY